MIMHIYTSYYACKNLPSNACLVQVSVSAPKAYKTDVTWLRVMPSYRELVYAHKLGVVTDQQYTDAYIAMLNKNKQLILAEFERIKQFAENRPIVLMCWCGKQSFCHRHILAKWLNDNANTTISEWQC